MDKTKKPQGDVTDYSHYASHSRFGQGPIRTGLAPAEEEMTLKRGCVVGLNLRTATLVEYLEAKLKEDITPKESSGLQTWLAELYRGGSETMVEGTAILADPARQNAMYPATHYLDLDKKCLRCGQRFIFFAREQKFWYEELGFPPRSEPNECADCRKVLRKLHGQRQRYEVLVNQSQLTPEETWEFADCVFSLCDEGIFGDGPLDHVRKFLKRIPLELRETPAHLRVVAKLAEKSHK